MKVELSHSQKRFWFLDKLYDSNIAMNQNTCCLKIEGDLKVTRFMRVFQQTLEKYEILNNKIEEKDGKPYLRDFYSRKNRLSVIEVDGDEAGQLDCMIKKISQKKINLYDMPLAQGYLIIVEKNLYYFIFCIHHIISDGHSLNLIINNMLKQYLLKNQLFIEEKSSKSDHHVRLEKQTDYKQFLNFWNEYLKTIPLKHGLPFKTSAHDYVQKKYLVLNDDENEIVGKIMKLYKTSKFVFFSIVTFYSLFKTFPDLTELLMGVPVNLRRNLSEQQMVGCLINTVVVRGSNPDNQTFKEYFDRNKKNIYNVLDNQIVPYDLVVKECRKLGTALNYTILFFENNTMQGKWFTNHITVSTVPLTESYIDEDLSISYQIKNEELVFQILYKSSIPAQKIDELTKNLEQTLRKEIKKYVSNYN